MECSFSGCENKAQTEKHGLCVGHHAQKFRYKIELKPLKARVKNTGVKCLVNSCGEDADSIHLCTYHRGQKYRGVPIELMSGKPKKKQCATWWCNKTAIKNIICGTCAARAREYNIEYSDYAILPRACEICGNKNRIHIDHDHNTGKFRGVLCQGCNTGIGQFGESVEKMQAAISYLEFWKN